MPLTMVLFSIFPPPPIHSLPFSLLCAQGAHPSDWLSQAFTWLAAGWVQLEIGSQKREAEESLLCSSLLWSHFC